MEDCVFEWVKSLYIKKNDLCIIGINGIQGSGKTTLCQNLKKRFYNENIVLEHVSIDDFYKTFDELEEIKRENEHDFRFHGRGNPGTHDISLLLNGLLSLQHKKTTFFPIYDKTLKDGLGDRSCNVKKVEKNTNIFIIEGWCIGFVPKFIEETVDIHVSLYFNIMDYLDGIVILKSDPHNAYKWRKQSEEHQKNGLSSEQIEEMVDRFFPTYNSYLLSMYEYWSFKPNSLFVDL